MRIHTVTARVNAAGDISTARWKISARREQQTTIRQALYPADARFSGAPVHRLGPTAVPGGAPLAFAPRTREDGFDVCTPRGRRGVGVRRADARAFPALDAAALAADTTRRFSVAIERALTARASASARGVAGVASLSLAPDARSPRRGRALVVTRAASKKRRTPEEREAARARREARERREAEAGSPRFEAEEAARREAGEDDADLGPADLDSDAGARAWKTRRRPRRRCSRRTRRRMTSPRRRRPPARRGPRMTSRAPPPLARALPTAARDLPAPQPEPGIDPVLVGAGALAVAAVGYLCIRRNPPAIVRRRRAAGAPTRVPTSRARTAPAAGRDDAGRDGDEQRADGRRRRRR